MGISLYTLNIRLTSFKFLETQFLRPLRQNRGHLGVGWYPPELVEISGSQKQNSGNKVGLGLRRRKVTQGFKVAQGSPPWGGGGGGSARISGNFLSFQQILGKWAVWVEQQIRAAFGRVPTGQI